MGTSWARVTARPGSRTAFDEHDVVDAHEISSRSLRGRNALVISERVSARRASNRFATSKRWVTSWKTEGIGLVSITPGGLREAIDQHGISAPMISDGDRDMSAAIDTLDRRVHSDTPGHAFVLLDGAGKAVWQRDYLARVVPGRCTSSPRGCSRTSRVGLDRILIAGVAKA